MTWRARVAVALGVCVCFAVLAAAAPRRRPTLLLVVAPPPPRHVAAAVRVAVYNACLLPFPVSRGGGRRAAVMAAVLPSVLAAADVVVLCELMSARAAAPLLAALAATWPHQSCTTRMWGRVCGGVRVVSRTPFVRSAAIVFAASAMTSDRLASKGAVYVQLAATAPDGSGMHLVATHMHADEGADGDRVRAAQLRELRDFVHALNLPPRDVVLLCGDLNMALGTAPAAATLRAALAPLQLAPSSLTAVAATYDEASNTMVGVDGSCVRGDGSCVPRQLDGVLALATHDAARIQVRDAAVVAVRDASGTDLSDHHALVATVAVA